MKTFEFRRLVPLIVFVMMLAALLAPNATTARAASSDNGQPQARAPEQYNCSYAARFVADVTIPDNTVLKPGTPFTKIWRIRNEGTCTWGSSGYPLHSLLFVAGTQLANSDGVPLPPRVLPREEIEISVPMVAPNLAGTYYSGWKLELDNGSLIGFGPSGQAPIYVQIVIPVIGPPSPGACGYYVVRYGDWLYSIALRFGVTWQAIVQANHLYNPNFIYAGQRLIIPCASAPVPPGPSQTYTSQQYHYAVLAPSGWTVKVNTSVPSGGGWNPEYVTFSPPGGSLPQIDVDVLTGTAPFTGYENCTRNLVFRGIPACSIANPAGQISAQRLLIFQRGNAYFHIAMRYENDSALAYWDSFLSSLQFTD